LVESKTPIEEQGLLEEASIAKHPPGEKRPDRPSYQAVRE